MPFISFNKATDPAAPDDLRINTASVLYVEASRPDLVGQTTIHMLGQGSMVNAVTETIGTVVSSIGGLVAVKRHYLAPPPDDGASTVYVLPANISYIRPNLPLSPEFWYLKFVDGSELRVMDPLPSGL
ncbi:MULTISPECIES: hypothetical protein [unclassified Polaromonas]|uniref:hypothetical protein n=1 Tax=unclassified Polaromonas TaxID=2638319 RepID=UPI000F08E0FD|nr:MULTISPECIES: hypothetical protein [unclassified Polaromonas]AYQ28757.1 hypothetical protein DT070_12405 [Polaromonas sp. SP1]QGJ20125.1 hypothetical protein F7R28_18185 [Polaromonas sp. Pch-P]